MSIKPVMKIDLLGPEHRLDAVVESLQALGVMHHVPEINLSDQDEEHFEDLNNAVEQAREALDYLCNSPQKRRPMHRTPEHFDFKSVVDQILQSKTRYQQLQQQKDEVLHLIKKLQPWGDYELPDSGELMGYRVWFYRYPLQKKQTVQQAGLPMHIINQDNQFFYFVVASMDQPEHEALTIPPESLPEQGLHQQEQHLDSLESEIEEIQLVRQRLTQWIDLLQNNIHSYEDKVARQKVKLTSFNDEHLFHIQGWVAKDQLDSVRKYCKQQGLALNYRHPHIDETPPTFLQAPEALSSANSLVTFYRTPHYYSWDPSLIIFFSFSMFFAMILSDAGYSLALLIGLGLGWKTLDKTKTRQRTRNLLTSVLGFSALYGVLAGSYFGIAPPEGTLLTTLRVLDLNQFDHMIEISVTIGVLHILIANLMNLIHARQRTAQFIALGWCALVAGGWLYWQAYHNVAAVLMLTGLCCILGFSSEHPLNSPLNLLKRLGFGLMTLTGASKAFGDVMSYMRLFALGLASSSLAITFNELAQQAYEASPGTGLFFSGLIILLGHALNIVLAIVSGVIHGLRLNYIEFFNWALSDEGYPFEPFQKKEQQL